jgi:energy-converting hydrogenase Eha subunit A
MLDFIERYFGVAPDNGDGSIKFLLVMFLIVLIVAIVVAILLRLTITKDRPS